MKRKKGSEHRGSRSLADQLKEAFPDRPPNDDANAKGKQKDHVAPTVRILSARPQLVPEPFPETHRREKRAGGPVPTSWEPPYEEIFLEPAYPHAAVRALFSTPSAVRVSAGTSRAASSGIRRTQTVATIQVGLDFGTSATKVLWVRTGVADRRVTALDFRHQLEDVPAFCLPSVAAFDTRGELLLGDVAVRNMRSGPAASALTRFKMLVAGEQDARYLDTYTQQRFVDHVAKALGQRSACTPEMITAAYLAFVMRRVRHALANAMPGVELDVSFVTCVPVDQVEHNTIVAAFRRVANAAERVERDGLDTESGRVWLERAQEALREPAVDPTQAKVHLIPEAVAATAGYVQSLQRDTGIHALVDIGAGTTDVSIFNIRDTGRGDPETVWYAAQSIPRGTAYLEARLAHELQRAGRQATPAGLLELLRGSRGALPCASSIIEEELKTIWRQTQHAWTSAHRHLRNEISWKGDAVNVFLSGGGALIPEATSTFRESWMQSPNWGPYPCGPVPDPDGYDARRVGGPFVRINVAYGLTMPVPELGKWVLPNDAPDDTPPPLPRRDVPFDGDQLVPKYGWT